MTMPLAPSTLPPITTAFHIQIVTPRDAVRGGEIEKTARNLASSLGRRGEFSFAGLEASPSGMIGALREYMELWPAIASTGCVWIHDCGHLAAIITYLAARHYHKPILITQHSDIDDGATWLQRALLHMLDRLITRPMLRTADQVVFSSDAVAEAYYHQVAFTKPIQIIPNGVDLDAFQTVTPAQRLELRHRFSLRDDQPVVIFAGRLTRRHDMQVIHNLAQLLPDWRFWLIGNGAFKPEKWFLPNVQVFRNRPRAARAALYQVADLMIAPHATARYPTGFQEALACGVPILCSPITAEGSHFAKTHVETENVDPRAPAETAWLWAETLKTKRDNLPRADCREELANIAQLFWDESKIASYYADILRSVSLPATRQNSPK